VIVPGFWDPRRRPERPDLSRIQTIRFLTEMDYPPFDYAGPDGNPAGFNVDLARLLCDEIKATCTIQARRFDTLLDALNDNRGDAVIASIAPTAETRRLADFTDPYYRTPARFAARRDYPTGDVVPERLEGKKVGVVAGTAHEAYLKAMFTEAEVRSYPTAEAARNALRQKEVDLLFDDGIALAFWLGGLLCFPRRAVSGEPVLRRGRRHCGQTRQRSLAAELELGAVSALGKGKLHRPLAALFPDQPVLTNIVAPLSRPPPASAPAFDVKDTGSIR
jgi:polar amino acid transport system substrate-binding protein